MIRKIMTACLSLILFAAAMPAQVRAEETGEEAETFESYYIIDEYTLVVTCYANGGKFDANEDGVSKDRKKKVCDLDIIIYEDDEDDENPKHLYTAEIGNLADGLSRKNCKFDGWYLDKGLTEKLEEKSTDGYGEFDKLYAKWIVVKGWEKTKEGWIYHLDENDYYTDGIYTIGGKKYGFDMNGIMITGWKKFSGKWHYFASSGVMAAGWKKISGKWYWFDADGIMAAGWKKISGKWYYFTSGGAMVTGWKKLSGKWYYFLSSGAMKTGWLKLNGKWYYFKSSGVMATGTLKIGSKTYTFNSSGVCQNP